MKKPYEPDPTFVVGAGGETKNLKPLGVATRTQRLQRPTVLEPLELETPPGAPFSIGDEVVGDRPEHPPGKVLVIAQFDSASEWTALVRPDGGVPYMAPAADLRAVKR